MKIKTLILPFISILLILSLTLTPGCKFINQTNTTPAVSETTSVATTSTLNNNNTNIPVNTGAEQPLPSIADVVAKVKPSVVAINVKATVTTYDFWGNAVQQEQDGAGSGWIISSDGLIVTNNHVVDGATSIMITLDDGTSLPVDLKNVETDALTDLAVLKVDATDLPALKIGDSTNLRDGDWVVAIGNSLGEGIRVTQGIVSRKNVTMQDENGQTFEGLIETDAIINPGNSGGPLVNMAGEVVGITNAKRVETGVEGVGYAISSNEALPIIQELISNGYIVRPYLGVSTETVESEAYAQWYGLGVNSGVRITGVGADSPADKAGLKVNDVIVKFDNQDITSDQQLVDAIHGAKVGQTVTITYWRGSQEQSIEITLTESPKPQGQ